MPQLAHVLPSLIDKFVFSGGFAISTERNYGRVDSFSQEVLRQLFQHRVSAVQMYEWDMPGRWNFVRSFDTSLADVEMRQSPFTS